ncbi:MAG: prepilin-type N-terminal cleavage/methylation domain-containing protein [Bacteriovoracaceae bacterium]|nr:prepilin-type N-terminal cleavage/methylation domain-containing protein [Bacteriovoracaceae bacterium]
MVTGINSQKGFSLIEVMIAITMFSIFLSAFLVSQGGNIASSQMIAEEVLLKNLATMKVNETILNPPVFTESLDGKKETKTFEQSEYSNYEHTIEFKKLEIPDFQDILMGGEKDEEKENKQVDQIQQLVFSQLKDNVEKIIWQMRVTVKNKETGFFFTLSTWMTNNDVPVQLNIQF